MYVHVLSCPLRAVPPGRHSEQGAHSSDAHRRHASPPSSSLTPTPHPAPAPFPLQSDAHGSGENQHECLDPPNDRTAPRGHGRNVLRHKSGNVRFPSVARVPRPGRSGEVRLPHPLTRSAQPSRTLHPQTLLAPAYNAESLSPAPKTVPCAPLRRRGHQRCGAGGGRRVGETISPAPSFDFARCTGGTGRCAPGASREIERWCG